jgi:ATP-binding cassette subfamily F protein 3
MLTVYSLRKSFNLQLLFDAVSFNLNSGERVGLIGPNGCGKTTLLRILAGLELPDSGHISHNPHHRIGYLAQGFELDPNRTLGEVIGQVVENIDVLENNLARTAVDLSLDPTNPYLQAQYDEFLRQIEYSESGKVHSILSGLGLARIPLDFPVRLLSGGQKTRLGLSLVLLHDPQILLLDEPTNHLDIEMLEWLETWLQNCPCAMLIVSHDRTFLDHTVNRILEMDPLTGKVKEYQGNYSDFTVQKQTEIEKQWSSYRDQLIEIKRMKQDIAKVMAQAVQTEREASSIRIGGSDYKIKGYKSYQQGIAKKVAKKAKSREKKLDRYIESDQRVEKPRRSWLIKLEFHQGALPGRTAIQLGDLAIGYNGENPILSSLNLEIRTNCRIVLTGPNGSGKTTLLRTIAGELNPIAGQIRLAPSVRLGYMSQDQSNLTPHKTVLETIQDGFVNETEARSFLAKFLFMGDEPLKDIAVLSYGQRARLMLARLVVDGCNCLLLDEPVNHLDIPSRVQFEAALKEFEGAVLAVVHDRYFIENFAQEVWLVRNGTIQVHLVDPATIGL